MKRIIYFFVSILLSFAVFIPSVNADGGFWVFDEYGWMLHDGRRQIAAINYQDGMERMILLAELGEQLYGEKGVWLFPVHAKPEKVAINICNC